MKTFLFENINLASLKSKIKLIPPVKLYSNNFYVWKWYLHSYMINGYEEIGFNYYNELKKNTQIWKLDLTTNRNLV